MDLDTLQRLLLQGRAGDRDPQPAAQRCACRSSGQWCTARSGLTPREPSTSPASPTPTQEQSQDARATSQPPPLPRTRHVPIALTPPHHIAFTCLSFASLQRKPQLSAPLRSPLLATGTTWTQHPRPPRAGHQLHHGTRTPGLPPWASSPHRARQPGDGAGPRCTALSTRSCLGSAGASKAAGASDGPWRGERRLWPNWEPGCWLLGEHRGGGDAESSAFPCFCVSVWHEERFSPRGRLVRHHLG